MYKGVQGVTEFSKDSWKAAMEQDEGRHLNLVVALYNSRDREANGLKQAMEELGREFVGKSGYVQAGAVNCGKLRDVCQEFNGQTGVIYIGPNKKKKRYSGDLSYSAVSSWVAKSMGDLTKVLSNDKDLRTWLVSDDKVPHVVFLTDRKSCPPLFKALSVEFNGRAALGLVLGSGEVVAKALGVQKRPALVHIVDEDSLETSAFDKEFKKEHIARFLSRAVGKHRSQAGGSLRELTAARLEAGDCSPTDGSFCLLHLAGAELAEGPKATLRSLAKRLQRDPVKVFYVRHAGYARAFSGAPTGGVILYRPKRKRFKVFEGEASDLDGLASFVDGAVGGGAPLPEVLKSTPSMGGRSEL